MEVSWQSIELQIMLNVDNFFFSHLSSPHQVEQFPGPIAASIKDCQSFVIAYIAIESYLLWV